MPGHSASSFWTRRWGECGASQAGGAIDYAVVLFHDLVACQVGPVENADGTRLDAVPAEYRPDEVEDGTELRPFAHGQQLGLHEQDEVIALVGLALPKRHQPFLGRPFGRADLGHRPNDLALKPVFVHSSPRRLNERHTPLRPGLDRRPVYRHW